MPERYRIYREHKYVLFMLTELERLIAKTDFTESVELDDVEEDLNGVIDLLKGHAQHEDMTIHQLLRDKNSNIFARIEADHQQHENIFKQLQRYLHEIKTATDNDKKHALGNHFYQAYRLFEAENLKHLHEEETVIMAELQKFYSDKELKEKLDFKTYQKMTVEQLVHMLLVLFQQFNANDRLAFLKDIFESVPNKFPAVWGSIVSTLSLMEQKNIIRVLGFDPNDSKFLDTVSGN